MRVLIVIAVLVGVYGFQFPAAGKEPTKKHHPEPAKAEGEDAPKSAIACPLWEIFRISDEEIFYYVDYFDPDCEAEPQASYFMGSFDQVPWIVCPDDCGSKRSLKSSAFAGLDRPVSASYQHFLEGKANDPDPSRFGRAVDMHQTIRFYNEAENRHVFAKLFMLVLDRNRRKHKDEAKPAPEGNVVRYLAFETTYDPQAVYAPDIAPVDEGGKEPSHVFAGRMEGRSLLILTAK